MMTKSNKDYQSAFRNRLRKAGLKRIDVWVHPEDEKQIRDLETRLKNNRLIQPACINA